MKLTLNREYAMRHLFVVALMLGLCCWFGYDGFVRYPATPAADLYEAIEGSKPPPNCNLEAFKRQKTQTQYGFTLLTGLAALVVGFRLFKSYKFTFSFDDEGFVHRGRRHAYSQIKSIDRTKWSTKGILKVDGITLDSWHHVGVKEFESRLKA